MKFDNSNYLYHYCGAEALLSILEHKEFWITKLGFMNDVSEGDYCHEIAYSYLAKKSRTLTPDKAVKLHEIAKTIKRSLWNQNAYILSFSENGDSLSQWRAYTPNGGYALGVHRESVDSLCKQVANCSLVNCDYRETVHQSTVLESMEEILEEYDWVHGEKGEADAIEKIRESIRALSVQFKHNSFSDEREHRIVVKTGMDNRCMRGQGHKLIPYTKLDAGEMLCPESRTHPIHIRFSPGKKIGKIREELYWWLLQQGYSEPELDESVSPYYL